MVISLQFRGRENEHRQLGFERVKLAAKELEGVASADSEPRLVGRQVTQLLSPLPESKRVLKFNKPDYQMEDHDVEDIEEHEELEKEEAQS